MATVDQLIIELIAQDNGAEATIERMHQRLDDLFKAAQEKSRKSMSAAENAGKKTAETVEDVGVRGEKANKRITESGKKVTDMFATMRGEALRFLGVFAMFSLGKKIVGDALDSAVALGKMSKATGVARQEIEALQKLGEKHFVDKETVNALFDQYATAQADMQGGKAPTNEFLHKLSMSGVQYTDKNKKFRTDFAEMMLEAGEHFRQLANGDEQQAIALARGHAGWSAEEARLIIAAKRDDYKATRDLIKTTNEQYEAEERVARQWVETKQRLEQLGRQVATKLMPILEKLTEWFSEFLEEISKDPEKLNELIVLFGALAVAIGLIFNPIGTAIGLFVGLIGVMYRLTNRFEAVRKVWDALVLAIKSGVNAITQPIADFLEKMGAPDWIVEGFRRMKFDTSADEQAIQNDHQGAGSNPTEYETSGETLPDYSGRSNDALTKSTPSESTAGGSASSSASSSGSVEAPASWSGGGSDMERWAAANVKNEAGSTGGVGKNGKPLLHLNRGKKFGKYNGTYDVGKYQLNELNGPFAARLAGVSWDRSRFFNDVSYANSLGLAYMKHAYNKSMRMFGNDPAKAFAYYHSPKAMVEANRHGSGWLEYLRTHYYGVYQSTTRKMSFLRKGVGARDAMSSSSTAGSASYGGNRLGLKGFSQYRDEFVKRHSQPTSYERPTTQGYSQQSDAPIQRNRSEKSKSGQPSAYVADAISNASRVTGMDERMMFGIAKAESNFKAGVSAGTSSAKGLYQFINSTWRSMVDRYGKQYGLTYGGVLDARQNAIAGSLYARENQGILRKAGIEANAADLYMAHFLGPGGAIKFIRKLRANPNASALTGASTGQINANKSIFYRGHYEKVGARKYRFVPESPRTLAEVYNLLRQRSTWNGGLSGQPMRQQSQKPVQQPIQQPAPQSAQQPVQQQPQQTYTNPYVRPEPLPRKETPPQVQPQPSQPRREIDFSSLESITSGVKDMWYGAIGAITGRKEEQPRAETPRQTTQAPQPMMTEKPPVENTTAPKLNPFEAVLGKMGGVFGNVIDGLKKLAMPDFSKFKLPDMSGFKMPDFSGLQPVLAGANAAYPAGAKQATYINNSTTINYNNTVNVDARGATQPQQVADKTVQGMDMLSRRVARGTR